MRSGEIKVGVRETGLKSSFRTAGKYSRFNALANIEL